MACSDSSNHTYFQAKRLGTRGPFAMRRLFRPLKSTLRGSLMHKKHSFFQQKARLLEVPLGHCTFWGIFFIRTFITFATYALPWGGRSHTKNIHFSNKNGGYPRFLWVIAGSRPFLWLNSYILGNCGSNRSLFLPIFIASVLHQPFQSLQFRQLRL